MMSKKTFADAFSKYQPNDAEHVDELWQTATIVIDTNVIGQLYRVARSSRDVLLSNLESLSPRLWMPHQVGVEYHRRREDLRNQTRADFTAAANELEQLLPGLQKRVKQIKDLDLNFDVQSHIDSVERSMRAIIDSVKESANGETKEAVDEDIYKRLNAIFDESNIGPAFLPKQLDRYRAQGIRRYELQIPPGFRDSAKKGDQALGDYFIWAQILKEFKKRTGGVIFVTNDNKEHWYHGSSGRTRTELHEEFAAVTGGRILLVNTPSFITRSSALLERNEEEAREAATEFGEEPDFDEWFIGTELGRSATQLAAAEAKERLFGPISGVAAATNALNGAGGVSNHFNSLIKTGDLIDTSFLPSNQWAIDLGIPRYAADLIQASNAINIMKDLPDLSWMRTLEVPDMSRIQAAAGLNNRTRKAQTTRSEKTADADKELGSGAESRVQDRDDLATEDELHE